MPQYGFDIYRFDEHRFDQRTAFRSAQERATVEDAYYKTLQKLVRDEGAALSDDTVAGVYKVLQDALMLADQGVAGAAKVVEDSEALSDVAYRVVRLRSLPDEVLGLDDYYRITASPDAVERVRFDDDLVARLLWARHEGVVIDERFSLREGQLPAYVTVGPEHVRVWPHKLTIKESSNDRVSVATFQVHDPSDEVVAACTIRADVTVLMVDGDKHHYFGGRIINNPLSGDGPGRTLYIEAEDYTAEAADYLVTGSFQGTVTDIIAELWSTFYERPYREDILHSDVTISVDFNYETLFDATEYLVEQIGWLWFIEWDGSERVLRVFPPETDIYDRTVAPGDLHPLADTPSFSQDSDLVNALYLFGGQGTSEPVSQTEVADGEKTIYYTYYKPVGLELFVDNVKQRVGIKYIHTFDDGFDVLLDYQEKAVEFPEDGRPAQGALIRYEYRYYYPIVVYMEDAESIADYGKVVARVDDGKLTTPEQARAFAEQYLRDHARPKLGGTVTITGAGIRAGMYVQVNLPKYGASGVFRVNQVVRWVERRLIFTRLDLNRITSSAEMFAAKVKELARRIDNLEARDRQDTVVQRYYGVGETLSFTDRYELTKARAGVNRFEESRWDFGVFA